MAARRSKKKAAPKPVLEQRPDGGGFVTKRMNLSDITPAGYNPRVALQPDDPEYKKLVRSIEEFGLVEPLIWNTQTGTLVGGHQRLTVMRDLGITETDVVIVELEPAREKALNIALNKISGRWDDDKLWPLIRELADADDIDALLTGFDDREIKRLMVDLDDAMDGDGADGAGGAVLDQLEYRIIVECSGEDQQRELLGQFKTEGLSCRALIS